MRISFKKLDYLFLVENTKIENASLPYKTAISEANVKTNWIVSTKWTYHKERSISVTTLFSKNFCFSLRTTYKERFDIPTTQMPIYLLFVSTGVLFDSAFSLRVSLRETHNLFKTIMEVRNIRKAVTLKKNFSPKL